MIFAIAPASVGNAAVGFDLLGHSIEGPFDRVGARRIDRPGVTIAEVRGCVTALPLEPHRNTAGRAVQSLIDAEVPGAGIELIIDKGIPLSSGLGGSAASAVAAVVAANAALGLGLDAQALYRHALAGEAVASGAIHGDNVAPQLLGGLVLALPDRMIAIPVPTGLFAAVVHPQLELSTRESRAALAEPFPLETVVAQTRHLAMLLSGCYTDDPALIGQGLTDLLVEPRRKHLIPGFDRVRAAALATGALGASISGAGPSVFGWFRDRESAERASESMAVAFAEAGLRSDRYVSPVAGPAARRITGDPPCSA
ncbi:homoserine kinase [Wenzhouxiangella sp. XN79A]|nr:homoserine kinase [Wenzhouxiangella sp. XN79A]